MDGKTARTVTFDTAEFRQLDHGYPLLDPLWSCPTGPASTRTETRFQEGADREPARAGGCRSGGSKGPRRVGSSCRVRLPRDDATSDPGHAGPLSRFRRHVRGTAE
jgi:hypothetical protein